MKFNLLELEQSALNGNGLSAYILGRSYFSGEHGVVSDCKKAFFWHEFGSKTIDNARCLYGMAVCYDDGEGVIEDKQKATHLFLEAYPKLKEQSDLGDKYSMFIVGAYHYYAFGNIKEDRKQAFKLIKNAADLGHMAGCFDIGKFYHNGDGCKVSFEQSKKYLQKAIQMGHSRAKELYKEWYEREKPNSPTNHIAETTVCEIAK